MKSEETWKVANAYANDLMLGVAVVVLIAQVILYIMVSPTDALLWGSILMCLLLVLIIPVVENYLKQHFDDQGNQKSGAV